MTMTTTMSSDRVGGVRRGTSEALFMGRASPSASRAPWWPDAQHLRVAHLQISSATHGTVSGFHFRGGAGATSFGSTSALEGGKDDELLTRDRELTRKTGPKRDSSSQGGRDGLGAKELKLQFWQGVSRFKLLRARTGRVSPPQAQQRHERRDWASRGRRLTIAKVKGALAPTRLLLCHAGLRSSGRRTTAQVTFISARSGEAGGEEARSSGRSGRRCAR
ncbi:hypothetical protein V8E36_001274 [Tilletia maclaganii]